MQAYLAKSAMFLFIKGKSKLSRENWFTTAQIYSNPSGMMIGTVPMHLVFYQGPDMALVELEF